MKSLTSHRTDHSSGAQRVVRAGTGAVCVAGWGVGVSGVGAIDLAVGRAGWVGQGGTDTADGTVCYVSCCVVCVRERDRQTDRQREQ